MRGLRSGGGRLICCRSLATGCLFIVGSESWNGAIGIAVPSWVRIYDNRAGICGFFCCWGRPLISQSRMVEHSVVKSVVAHEVSQ